MPGSLRSLSRLFGSNSLRKATFTTEAVKGLNSDLVNNSTATFQHEKKIELPENSKKDLSQLEDFIRQLTQASDLTKFRIFQTELVYKALEIQVALELKQIQAYSDFLNEVAEEDRADVVLPDSDSVPARIRLLKVLNTKNFVIEDLGAVLVELSFEQQKVLLQEKIVDLYNYVLKNSRYQLTSAISPDNKNPTSIHLGFRCAFLLERLNRATQVNDLEEIWVDFSPYLFHDQSLSESHISYALFSLLFYWKKDHSGFSSLKTLFIASVMKEIEFKKPEFATYLKNQCIQNPHFLSFNSRKYSQNKEEFNCLKKQVIKLMEDLLKEHPKEAHTLSKTITFPVLLEKIKKSHYEIDIYDCLYRLGIREHHIVRKTLQVLDPKQPTLVNAYFADPQTSILAKWYWLIKPDKNLISFPMDEDLKKTISQYTQHMKTNDAEAPKTLEGLAAIDQAKDLKKEDLEQIIWDFLKNSSCLELYLQRVQKIKSCIKWQHNNPLFWSIPNAKTEETLPSSDQNLGM